MINSKRGTSVTALLLVLMLLTGCTANWIQVALNDLPVLLQMALNIASLVGTIQSGQSPSAAEIAAINNISAAAKTDLTLIQSLYNDYKANPSATTLQKIQDAISAADQELPGLLQAAHIMNAVLAARISAAVSLILTTIDSFAALIPAPIPGPVAASRRLAAKPLNAKQLKQAWLAAVGVPLQ